MAKKSKKQRKREERDRARAEEEAARETAAKRLRTYRIAAAVVPAAVLGICLGVFALTDDRRLAALLGLVGFAVWIPVILGALGGGVTPRDSTRAGSIDFGNRR